MNNKYKLLLKDTFIFAIGSLGSKVILFFLVPLYTNYLTTAEYGTADLVSTFSTLLVPVVSLSIERAVIRFGMKQGLEKEKVLLNSLFILLCSAVATYCIMPLMGLYKTIGTWRGYLAIQIILTNAAEIEKAYLKVKNMNKAYSIIGIGQTAVLAISNLVLLTVYHTGVKGYLVSNNIALFFCVFLCFFVGKINKDIRGVKIEWKLLRQMIAYSSPLIFSGISWWILHSSDKIMIEWMIGAAALGLYTAATKIPSLINVMIGIFNQAWGLSSIREIESSNDQKFYASTFDKFTFLLYGVGLIFITFCKPFMGVYVGAAFRDSWVFTPFLLFAAVYYSIFSFIGSLYVALQKTVNDMWTSVLCAILNIIINYIGIKMLGAGGAVMGTAVSYFVFSAIRILDIRKYMSFGISTFKYIINSGLILAAACIETFSGTHVYLSVLCVLVFAVMNKTSITDFYRHTIGMLRRQK